MNFLSLNNISFNYPFDLIAGIFLFLILIFSSLLISKKIILINDIYLNYVSSFVILISSLSIVFYLISLIGFNYNSLRLSLWSITIILPIFYFNEVKELIIIVHKFIRNNSFISLIFLSFFFISLLPSLDADTLDYHLGVGLDIIREGKLNNRQDWLHFRLAGAGEYINLIGLIFGSKNFGQIIQFSSLLILFFSLKSVLGNKNQNKIFYYLIFSSPILIILIFSQKYQLLGSSLIFFSFVLLHKFSTNPKRNTLTLIIFSTLFLTTLKHSFIIPGLILLILTLYFSKIKNHLFYFFLNLSVLFLILCIPHYIKNLYFYGDPISPLLEHFKNTPSEDIINFSNSIKIAEEKLNMNNFYIFFLNIFIPINLSSILSFVGVPALLIFLSHKIMKFEHKFLLIFIICYFLIFIFLGQNSIRYYIDIIFVLILIFALNFKKIEKNNVFKMILKINYFQSITIIFINFFIVSIYLPKGFNQNAYEKILKKYAINYEEILWIKGSIPHNALVISENIRSNSLYQNSFITQDYIKYFQYSSNELKNYFKEKKINYVVLDYPIKKKFSKFFDECADRDTTKIKDFQTKTRNPLSKYKFNYEMILFKNICN